VCVCVHVFYFLPDDWLGCFRRLKGTFPQIKGTGTEGFRFSTTAVYSFYACKYLVLFFSLPLYPNSTQCGKECVQTSYAPARGVADVAHVLVLACLQLVAEELQMLHMY
jgi:hypothetical protein